MVHKRLEEPTQNNIFSYSFQDNWSATYRNRVFQDFIGFGANKRGVNHWNPGEGVTPEMVRDNIIWHLAQKVIEEMQNFHV